MLDGGILQVAGGWSFGNERSLSGPAERTSRITTLNEHARVKLPEFLTASGDPKNNALSRPWMPAGTLERPLSLTGRVIFRTAIMFPSDDFYNADKTFKSADEIRRMLSYLGVKPEQQVYTYCGGGIAASVPFFAARFILDYPGQAVPGVRAGMAAR